MSGFDKDHGEHEMVVKGEVEPFDRRTSCGRGTRGDRDEGKAESSPGGRGGSSLVVVG